MICKLEKLYFICDYSQIMGSSNGKNAEYFETNRNYIDEIIHSCYNFLIEHKRKRVRWKEERINRLLAYFAAFSRILPEHDCTIVKGEMK